MQGGCESTPHRGRYFRSQSLKGSLLVLHIHRHEVTSRSADARRRFFPDGRRGFARGAQCCVSDSNSGSGWRSRTTASLSQICAIRSAKVAVMINWLVTVNEYGMSPIKFAARTNMNSVNTKVRFIHACADTDVASASKCGRG